MKKSATGYCKYLNSRTWPENMLFQQIYISDAF